MDIVVILALVVAAVVCLLPGIMAWSHYFGGTRETAKKRKYVSSTKPVITGNA
jgi:hypothetical protein